MEITITNANLWRRGIEKTTSINLPITKEGFRKALSVISTPESPITDINKDVLCLEYKSDFLGERVSLAIKDYLTLTTDFPFLNFLIGRLYTLKDDELNKVCVLLKEFKLFINKTEKIATKLARILGVITEDNLDILWCYDNIQSFKELGQNLFNDNFLCIQEDIEYSLHYLYCDMFGERIKNIPEIKKYIQVNYPGEKLSDSEIGDIIAEEAAHIFSRQENAYEIYEECFDYEFFADDKLAVNDVRKVAQGIYVAVTDTTIWREILRGEIPEAYILF